MILKDVESFEVYDCKTKDCVYVGWARLVYVEGMRHVLENLDSQPTIDPESLPVVQQLRAEVERLNKGIENLSKNVEVAYKQRDAAVNDLRECAIEDYAECIYCSRRDKDTLCQNCVNGSNWEWRGVKDE